MKSIILAVLKLLSSCLAGFGLAIVLLIIGAWIDLPIYRTEFMRGDQQCFREYRTSMVFTVCLPTHLPQLDLRNRI